METLSRFVQAHVVDSVTDTGRRLYDPCPEGGRVSPYDRELYPDSLPLCIVTHPPWQCMSPGCNTCVDSLILITLRLTHYPSHFCYVCGSLIIKSVKRKDIQQAVGAHYRVCRLFEVPE